MARISTANHPDPDQLRAASMVAYRQARRAGASEADADDVAQDTVEQLIQSWARLSLHDLSTSGTWSGYVAAMARNRVKQIARADSRRTRRQLRYLDVGPVEGPDASTTEQRAALLDDDGGIEVLLQRCSVLKEAAHLPAQQRRYIRYILEEGLSVNAIAELVGVQPAAVAATVRRAITTLREQLRVDDSLTAD